MESKDFSIKNFTKAAERALNGHYYVRVVKNENKFKTNHVKLSSYIRTMSDDNEFIYLPSHKHAGNYHTLREYLLKNGFDEASVDTELENAYSIHNYKEKRDVIEEEIKTIPSKEKEELPRLGEIAKVGALVKKTKTLGPMEDAIPTPSTPKDKVAPKNDIKTRLENLDTGKVLDISLYNPVTKVGVRTVNRMLRSGSRMPLGTKGDLKNIFFDFTRDKSIASSFLQNLGYTKNDADAIIEECLKPASTDLSQVKVAA